MRTYNDIILDLIALVKNKELTEEETNFLNGIINDYYILQNCENTLNDDDVEFENVYEVRFYDIYNCNLKAYEIEADCEIGAETAATEFLKDDYPRLAIRIDRVEVEWLRKVR